MVRNLTFGQLYVRCPRISQPLQDLEQVMSREFKYPAHYANRREGKILLYSQALPAGLAIKLT